MLACGKFLKSNISPILPHSSAIEILMLKMCIQPPGVSLTAVDIIETSSMGKSEAKRGHSKDSCSFQARDPISSG